MPFAPVLVFSRASPAVSACPSTLRRDCPRGARASNQRSANASGTRRHHLFDHLDWGLKSYRGRRPGASLRGHEDGNGDLQKEPPGGITTEPDDHGLGRSRGGLTTKLHLAVEQGQKPMSIVITAGQWGDSPQFEPVLKAICVPRIGSGRPRPRPDRVRADKTYASRNSVMPHRSEPVQKRRQRLYSRDFSGTFSAV
ncbi:transposase [Streptomyces sp. NPDC058391]